MEKRIFNLFVVFIMTAIMLLVLGVSASAESDVESGIWGGIEWTLDADGTLTIAPTQTPVADSSSNGKWTYEPGEWREAVIYKSNGGASAIGGWPYDRSKVKKLVIEEGVTSIGSFTVQEYTNLTGEVIIPSTVTYIGQEAFQKSTMTKLTFAKGGTEELCIAQGAFKNLIIEEIALPDDRPVHVHAWQFLNSKKLKKITFPATLTSITGTIHVDYNHNPGAQNGGNASTSTLFDHSNSSLETIVFENHEVEALFKNYNLNNYEVLISKLSSFSITYQVEPTYTVTIPATVELGQTITVEAENVVVVKGMQIEVSLSNANGFKVKTAQGAELTYTVKSGETAVAENDIILVVNPDNGKFAQAPLTFVAPESVQFAGDYTGTIIFTIAVKPAENN